MKKNVLALSISAAVCGLGMIGSAHAVTDLGVVGTLGAATRLKVNPDGIGHNVIVPYYTAQGSNATLLTLTNTAAMPKAVKIRFRGAANSDDVRDFQVFLSPNDVWTAMVSQSATGEAQIVTNDVSCTKPAFTAGTAVKFGTARLDTTLTAAQQAAGTREGYIEIFNMADITAGTALATAVTHVAGKAPCSSTAAGAAALAALDTDSTGATYIAAGLALPTTGLTASWSIINTTTGAAYGGRGVALQALSGLGAPTSGNLVYWPQNETFVVGETRGYTADPLLAGNLTAVPAVVPAIKALNQDLPDMSTPYAGNVTTVVPGAATTYNTAAGYGAVTDNWAAVKQASVLTAALAAVSVSNEFFTDSATVTIGAATDWVFSMPTRRYNVAFDYAAGARVYTDYTLSYTAVAAVPANVNYFTAANTAVQSRVVCVDGITPVSYNREETTVSSVTFSPSASPVFCGEVGVWGINQTAPTASAVLGASVAVRGADATYSEGWMRVATPGLGGIGLPVVGASFTKASSNASTNYGINTDHRVTRVAGYVY